VSPKDGDMCVLWEGGDPRKGVRSDASWLVTSMAHEGRPWDPLMCKQRVSIMSC
jgi:hypothetical protein